MVVWVIRVEELREGGGEGLDSPLTVLNIPRFGPKAKGGKPPFPVRVTVPRQEWQQLPVVCYSYNHSLLGAYHNTPIHHCGRGSDTLHLH